ncbi:SWI/SNF complex component snf12 [Podochytrium sp. JEL0797]|nr:SWI/SNF complex component snf12 [Podochytrium sp. JEL0797]
MQQMNMGMRAGQMPMMFPGQMPPGMGMPPPGMMMGGAGVMPGAKRGAGMMGELASVKRRRPLDRSLPTRLDFVPEAKLYANLQTSEKHLDSLVAAKTAALRSSLRSLSSRTSKTLRLFVANTAVHQFPPQGDDLLAQHTPAWSLKVHGVLVHEDGSTTPAKLSDLCKSVSVRILRDAQLYADGGNAVEWRRGESAQVQAFDAFEVTRNGDKDVAVKIAIVLDAPVEMFKLSSELASILNVTMESKANAVMRLWQYIKTQGLQDIEDKRMINFDEPLQKIFRTKKVLLTHLPDLLSSHFSALDPVTIDYTVKVDQPVTVSDVAYEVAVEVEDADVMARIAKVVGGGDPAMLKEISQIDDEITKLVQKVTQCKHKREFMLGFARDPVGFLNQWVSSQTRDLEVVLGDSRINAEEARRASFYKENWVNEAVFHYLNSV